MIAGMQTSYKLPQQKSPIHRAYSVCDYEIESSEMDQSQSQQTEKMAINITGLEKILRNKLNGSNQQNKLDLLQIAPCKC